ncbi:MAG: class I adenylate-forming enzyme family protein [Kofleriaceae bacterium]
MSALGDRLRDHARTRPTAHAVHTDGRWWTYGELVERADQLAVELALVPGDVIAIAVDRGIRAVSAACAAALAGAITAVVEPRDPDRLAPILDTLRPKAVITAAEALDRPDAPIARDPRIALVLYTSGSAATPKAVVWSEARLRFDLALAQAHHSPPACAGIAAPLSTSFGFKDLVMTLYRGGSCVLVETPFVWGLDVALSLGIERINLTPTHVHFALASERELGGLRQIGVGAAPINATTIAALAQRAPDARVGRIYGLTETGVVTALWLPGGSSKLHSVGRPSLSRGVTIRDAAGRVQPAQTWGNVVVQLPVWDEPDGYLDAPPELQRRFHNAQLWTGDRGKLDADGYLVLGARLSELIKVGGRSTSAPFIENALATRATLAVIGTPDPTLGEVPAVVYEPAPGVDLPALVADAHSRLRADEVPRWWLPRPVLPRGSLDKIDRATLAREVRRWAAAFPNSVATDDDRLVPAADLDADVSIADVALAPWFESARNDAAGRYIALVERRTGRTLAGAWLQVVIVAEGAGGAARVMRCAVGPVAIAGASPPAALVERFAARLADLAQRLPGPDGPVHIVRTATEHELPAEARACVTYLARLGGASA